MAQGPVANPGWETCLQASTRACILDQARIDALSIMPSADRASTLATVAAAQAATGDFQAAFHTAQSIPYDQAPHVTALKSIAVTQVWLGMMDAARETLIQARQLANALIDQLNRAELLQSIGLAEAESGMTAEAAQTFEESLKLAESIDIVAGPTPCPASSVEGRLDRLLQLLAQQMAKAGNISGSLRAVRSIVYEPSLRAETLRAIAESQAQSGQKDAARQVLKEALVWFQVPPPERWPSCPGVRHLPPSGDLDAWTRPAIARSVRSDGFGLWAPLDRGWMFSLPRGNGLADGFACLREAACGEQDVCRRSHEATTRR